MRNGYDDYNGVKKYRNDGQDENGVSVYPEDDHEADPDEDHEVMD